MSSQRSNLTDRAKRYRAQNAVRGEHRCVLCNARGRLDVMHLDGDENHGEPANLAHGCRSCNGKLAAAFKRIGAGVLTNQYNPAKGGVPSFAQYAWAVTQQQHSGEHGEAGAVIHATPRSKRIEYARRIADLKASRHNLWPFSSKATSSRQTMPASARSASRYAPSPERIAAREKSLSYKGYRVYGSDEAGWRTSLGGGDSRFDSEKDVKAFITSWNRKNRGPHSRLGAEVDSINREILGTTDAKKLKKLLERRDKLVQKTLNPGQGSFARCVAAVSRRGGVDDSKAVCAASKRRTPEGAAELQRAAAKGRRKNIDPVTSEMLGQEFIKMGGRLKKKATGNPADAAASMYQKFHGRPSGKVMEVEKPIHYHAHLAALGELEKLTVRSNDGGLVDLEGFGDAVLCSNERGTQLYIEGGDQAVKLSAFGIGKPYHDVEDLGEVTKLWYFTTKDHLGDQGGEASYHHTLSEEKKTRMSYGFGERRAPKPRLLYDVVNESLSFAGGEYTVEPEGIRN